MEELQGDRQTVEIHLLQRIDLPQRNIRVLYLQSNSNKERGSHVRVKNF